MRTLRPDQESGIDRLREALRRATRPRVIFKAPCGYGKTVVAADIVERARERNKRVMLTVPAISLIDQTVESFYAHGIRDIGVIQANHIMTDWSKPVQIASIDTLRSRGEMPECDIALVDECHKWFDFYGEWFNSPAWERKPIIGLSATPWARGLGAWYYELVIGNTIEAMIRDRLLAPYRVYAPAHPDLKDVRTTAGDYNQGDLGEAMDQTRLIADIVESWGALGRGRKTILFGVNRAHAEHCAQRFEQAGVGAAYMDCETKLPERRDIYRRLLSGQVEVVCNVDVAGVGVDWPEVSCIVYARPTKSEMRFVQNIGRGLRPHPNKPDCLIIDHSDTHLRLGMVGDLDASMGELNEGKTRAKASDRDIPLPKECPNCSFLKPPRKATCPACGHKSEQHQREIEREAAGRLEEFNGAKASPSAKKFPDKELTFRMLLAHAQNKNYKRGWASNKFKDLYGHWPARVHGLEPAKISWELASWIKAGQIRWAKGKRRAEHLANGGNGKDEYRAPQTARDHEIIERVREKYAAADTLCTADELEEFGRG